MTTELVIFLLISTGIYFLPTLIASARKNRQTTAIGMLNLILGWTGIGWVVAFIWAFVR